MATEKRCAICNKNITFEEFLDKHILCTEKAVEAQYPEALNTAVVIREDDEPIYKMLPEFCDEYIEDLLGHIDEINQIFDEESIPLYLAEIVGVSKKTGAWNFYLCNKETILEESVVGNDMKYSFTYPEKYPTVEELEFAYEYVSEHQGIQSLVLECSEGKTNFSVNADNVIAPAEYEKRRHDFKDFIQEQEDEQVLEELEIFRKHKKAMFLNNRVNIFLRIWNFIIYHISGRFS